jgi:hypothetical protein
MFIPFYEMQTSIVPASGAMPEPDYDAGASCSASYYESAEHIVIFAMVVAERELRQVERETLAANLMVAANDTALEQCPEAFNRVGMYVPPNVFMGGVINDFVRHSEMTISRILIRDDKLDAALSDLRKP